VPPDVVTHAEAVRFLTTALRKEYVEALLRSWLARVDDLEAEAQDLGARLFDLDALEGEPLRVVARIIGAPQVAGDDEQRLLIRTRLLVVRSSGTGDDLLAILAAFVTLAELELVEYQPAAVVVGRPHSFAQEAVSAAFLQEARAAGVLLQLVYSPVPEAETFRHSPATEYAADQAEAFAEATGLTAEHLWIGDLADEVEGATLTVEGGATIETTAEVLLDTYGQDAYVFDGDDGEAFAADDATIGDLDDAQATAFFVVLRLDAVPAVTRVVLGKQDDGVSFDGWQIFVRASVSLVPQFRSDFAGLSTVDLTAASQVTGDVLVYCAVDDPSTGEIRFASHLEAGTPAARQLASPATTALRIGDSRPATPIPAFQGIVHLVAICRGAQVEGLDELAAAQALYASVVPQLVEDSERGYGDAPDAVASYEAVTGLTAAHLWTERLEDSVAGSEVAPVGDGEIAVETLATVESWGELVYRGSVGLNGFLGIDAVAGDVAAGTSALVAVAYRLPDFVAGSTATIAGKRDAGPPFVGWEIYVTAAGLLEVEVDDGLGGTVTVTLTGAGSASGWHVAVLRYDDVLGEVALAIESEELDAAFSFGGPGTDPIGWGTYRGVPGPDLEVKLVAVSYGAQVEAVDPQALALALRDSLLVEGFPLFDGGAYAGVVE
jgi:hypothetical protein